MLSYCYCIIKLQKFNMPHYMPINKCLTISLPYFDILQSYALAWKT